MKAETPKMMGQTNRFRRGHGLLGNVCPAAQDGRERPTHTAGECVVCLEILRAADVVLAASGRWASRTTAQAFRVFLTARSSFLYREKSYMPTDFIFLRSMRM